MAKDPEFISWYEAEEAKLTEGDREKREKYRMQIMKYMRTEFGIDGEEKRIRLANYIMAQYEYGLYVGFQSAKRREEQQKERT